MTMRPVFMSIVLAMVGGLGGCTGGDVEPAREAVPNPASVYCEDNGGSLELREEQDGSTQGICVFDDGSECEEWAYLRGECAPGADEPAEPSEPSEPAEPTDAATVTVQVFFANPRLGDPCGEVFPVERTVAAEAPLAPTLAQLVAGPTETERDAGYEGWFDEQTAQALRSVAVSGGTAEVDFADLRQLIPNASTSCGSAGLLGQLDRTVLQFPGIDQSRYSIDGSTSAFYEWLQLAVPDGP